MARNKQLAIAKTGSGAPRKDIPTRNKHIAKGKSGSRRFRPGTVALREIRRYQRSSELLLKKLPFQR